jgi:hypothetical protein
MTMKENDEQGDGQATVDLVEIDFSSRKTESEWQSAIDNFWLKATPKLFEWTGWVALLAGLDFVNAQNPSVALWILIVLCKTSLFFYFNAYFSRFDWRGIVSSKSRGVIRVISLAIAGVVTIAAQMLAQYASAAIAKGSV